LAFEYWTLKFPAQSSICKPQNQKSTSKKCYTFSPTARAHVLTHLRGQDHKARLFRTAELPDFPACSRLEPHATSPPTEGYRDAPRTDDGRVLSKTLVVVPILRAGLGMLQPFNDIFPDVSVGHVGLGVITPPPWPELLLQAATAGRHAQLVVDPMLATGGSAAQAIQARQGERATEVRLVCIVGSPEGVATVEKAIPRCRSSSGRWTGPLNSRRYILPGLGDFGDRLYGT